MSVHVRDMCSLDATHPDVAQEFRNGKFIWPSLKENSPRSPLTVELLDWLRIPTLSLRWAVAGPELIRVTSEFGTSIVGKRKGSSQINHHEQTYATQRLFVKQLNSLVDIIDDMGNPFDEESSDILRLHSRDIMDNDSVDCLKTIQAKGQEQYATFVEERLQTNAKPITSTITRNKVVLFNKQAQRSNKANTKAALLQSESSLFSRLYIACHTRDGDLDNFFTNFHHLCHPMGNFVYH